MEDMGRKARRQRQLRQRHADDTGFPHEDPDVVEIGPIFDNSSRLQFSQPRCGRRYRVFLLGDDQERVARRQLQIGRGNDILACLADHGHLSPAWKLFDEIVEAASRAIIAQRHLAHMEALHLWREFWLNQSGHEVDAQDRADDTERIGHRISDRRVVIAHDFQGGLKGGGARH